MEALMSGAGVGVVGLAALVAGVVVALIGLSAQRVAKGVQAEMARTVDMLGQLGRDHERLIEVFRGHIDRLREEIDHLHRLEESRAAVMPPPAIPPSVASSVMPPPPPAFVPRRPPPPPSFLPEEAEERTTLIPGRRPAAPPPPPPPPVLDEDDDDGTLITGQRLRPEAGADEEDAGDSTLILSGDASAERRFHGMAFLRITSDVEGDREFQIPFGLITFGRAPTNALVLVEDKASRVHAEIRYDGDRFILKDLGSTNGTYHNGNRATENPLGFGDIIRVGRTEMRFTAEGFDLKDNDPRAAIAAFEAMLEHVPDFVPALQNLAFLLERDVTRRREAPALWERLKQLEPAG